MRWLKASPSWAVYKTSYVKLQIRIKTIARIKTLTRAKRAKAFAINNGLFKPTQRERCNKTMEKPLFLS